MVKPSRSMEPDAVDLEKAGRAAGKSFQDDSFRNYMARKIHLQRQQFGLVLPPDPRKYVGGGGEASEQDSTDASTHRAAAQAVPPSVSSSPVRREKAPTESKKQKRTKMRMSAVLGSLKRRHGTGRRSSRKRQRCTQTSAQTSVNLSEPEAATEDITTATFTTREQSNGKAASTRNQTDLYSTSPVVPSRKQRPDLFMTGVVVLVNGYTNPDIETLQRLLHKHGGDLEKYETSRITHIIAEQLSSAKANIYIQRKRPIPICRPEWIVDCVAAKKQLPHADYLLDQVKNGKVNTIDSFFGAVTTTTEQDALARKAPPPGDKAAVGRQATSNDEKRSQDPFTSAHRYPKHQPNSKHVSFVGDPPSLRAPFKEPINNESVVCDQLGSHDSYPPNTEQVSERQVNRQQDIHQTAAAKLDLRQPASPSTRQEAAPSATADTDYDAKPSATMGKTDDKYIHGKLRTVGTDPNFLESFFKSSRLSFIGSYKLRAPSSPLTKRAHKSKSDNEQRFVLHVDLDCFFANVALRNFPEHRGKPVVISHHGQRSDQRAVGPVSSKSTSECATCNYEARKYGIEKGMYLGSAKELCPNLVVLYYDFEGYEEVSEAVSEILFRYAALYNGTVEQVSCDESYMEVFLSGDDIGKVGDIADRIRQEIFDTTECTASVGVGFNKFLAKLGTDQVKPNGSLVVWDYKHLLSSLKLRELHGIGNRTDRKLAAEGLSSVQDVWDLGDRAEGDLCRILGQGLGKKILGFCRGEDDRPVQPAERKTIGAECNYGVRFDGPYGVDYMIAGLSKEVERRMEGVGMRGSRVTLKLKQRKKGAKPPPKFLGHGSCHNLSKSSDTPGSIPTRDWSVLSQIGGILFEALDVPIVDVRGMGITVSKLVSDQSSSARSDQGTSSVPQITRWLLSATGSRKADKKSKANFSSCEQKKQSLPLSGLRRNENTAAFSERASIQIDEENGDDTASLHIDRPTEREKSSAYPVTFSQIDQDVLSCLPPDIRTEIEESIAPGGTSNRESPSLEHSHMLRSDSTSDVEILEDLEHKGSPAAVDECDDIVLPPLSQIHMSQVEELPTPLKEGIQSKIRARKATRKPRSPRSSELENTKPSYRQVDVKRMMRLAALKSDHQKNATDQSLSLTQLECLPLEVQLQIANEDGCEIGSRSPTKRTLAPEKRRSSKRGRQLVLPRGEDQPLLAHRPAATVPAKSVQDKKNEGTDSSGTEQKTGKIPLFLPAADPRSFYLENVVPLQSFMDENPCSSQKAVDQVVDFFSRCIQEYRFSDVVVLLRSVKNREDSWGGTVYSRILDAVNDSFSTSTGHVLDIDALGL